MTQPTQNSSITAAAKTLQIPSKQLFKILEARRWIYRRPGQTWRAYHHRVQTGLLTRKAGQILLTPQGISTMHQHLTQLK